MKPRQSLLPFWEIVSHVPFVFWRYLTKYVCESLKGAMVGPDIYRALAIVGFQTRPCDAWPTPVPEFSNGEGFTYTCWDNDGCSSPLRFCNWDLPIDGGDFWLPEHNPHVHRFFADYL